VCDSSLAVAESETSVNISAAVIGVVAVFLVLIVVVVIAVLVVLLYQQRRRKKILTDWQLDIMAM